MNNEMGNDIIINKAEQINAMISIHVEMVRWAKQKGQQEIHFNNIEN